MTRYDSANDELMFQIKAAGLPEPIPEHRFHGERRWRFDYAYPEYLIAIEIEGGVWIDGRHTRGGGFEGDCEKYNSAACLGWRLLRFTPAMIRDGRALATIELALQIARPVYNGERTALVPPRKSFREMRMAAEETRIEFLNKLGLDAATSYCLIRAGIRNVDELVESINESKKKQYPNNFILYMRGIGDIRREKILKSLEENGYLA
jgi:hypothetical protein